MSLKEAKARRSRVLSFRVFQDEFYASSADMLADHGAVFGLHQAVAAALPRPAPGLFDAQFIGQPGCGFVDERAAVVRVKSQDAKRKLTQHVLENRLPTGLRDAWRCAIA